MKKHIIFLISIFYFFSSYAQEWDWVQGIKGSNSDVEIFKSITDSEGNIYTFGHFTSEVTDIMDASNIITSAGNNDLFLAKYDTLGNPIWMRFMQSADKDSESGISIDNNNNIYLLGTFKNDDCTFPSPSNTVTLVNQGSYDIFIAKYNPDGDLVWAKNAAWGSNINFAGGLHIDNTLNRVIFSGWYRVDTNFGDDFANPTATINVSAKNGMFVANLDLDGNYITNYNFDIPTTSGYGNIVKISEYNNAYYFVGKMKEQVNFGSTLLSTTSGTDQDAFVLKTDLNFNELWVEQIHGTALDYISSFVVNTNGIYMGGYSLSSTITFETASGSSVTENLSGTTYDLITTKYDHNGNYLNNYVYVGAGDNKIFSTTSAQNSIVFAGEFSDELIIDADTLNSTNSSTTDVFWLITHNDISPIYADQTSGTGSDRGVTAYIDNTGNLYLSGSYKSSPISFDSDYGHDATLNTSTAGFYDGFVSKFNLCSNFDLRIIDTKTSCPLSSDGKLKAIVLTDTSSTADTVKYNFEYLWSTGSTIDSIIDLSVGEYNLQVLSEKGCYYYDTIQLISEPILQTQLTDTVTLNCFYDTYPTDTVFASLGQRPYTYTWSSTYGSDSVITNAPVGIHIVTVSDACGTSVIDTIKIGNIPTLTTTISTHNTIIACANGNDGEAWMNTNNGVAPYTYSWENSASTSYIASDLAIGLHHVTITDGCISIEDSVNVVNLPAMNANISTSTDVTCLGNTDGTATAFVVGGVQPYNFNWSSGEIDTNIAHSLAEGMAYLTVSDACGFIIDSVEIGLTPSMTIQLSANHETCSNSNGEVIVVANNGSGNYSYSWDTIPSSGPISNNDTVSNLPAQRYYVTVTDACGSKIDSIDLTNNPSLQLTLSSYSITLFCDTSSNGSITANASNGVLPYTYEWASGIFGDNTNDTLRASLDFQYVTVTDACGTSLVDSFKVGFAPKLVAFAEKISDANCSNTNDGKASVIATGGVQPYTYTWSNSTNNSNIVSDLPVGIQYITVSDYCGNTIDSVQINNLPTMSFTLTPSGLQCPNDSLGNITANVTNGITPFNYNWGTSSNLNSNYIDSLWSGVHYVTITDACNQPQVDSTIILSSTPLNANIIDDSYNVLCESSNNGRAELTIHNGIMPYSYIWSSGETTENATNLTTGMQYVTISDMCNDTIKDSIFVSYLPGMLVNIQSENPLCYNDSNGIITLNITQGIQPYLISWNDFTGESLIQDSLFAKTYKFSVTDQCITYTDSVTLVNPDSIIVSGIISDESVSSLSDGSIILSVSGGTTPYSYNWNNGETVQDLVNIPAGTYIVYVSDYNKCSSNNSFEVKTKVETIEPVDAFTPNGDGVNETWMIKNIDKFPDSSIKIFNQWGNLIFESTGYDEAWDGTNNGKELSSAVYYYIIDLKDGSDPQSGSVTVIR